MVRKDDRIVVQFVKDPQVMNGETEHFANCGDLLDRQCVPELARSSVVCCVRDELPNDVSTSNHIKAAICSVSGYLDGE